jgi:hypothetical protein
MQSVAVRVRNCLNRSGHSQSPEHQATHRHGHHRFPGLASPLVVLAQATVLPEPGTGACPDPPPREDRAGGTGGGCDGCGHQDPPRGRVHYLRRPAQVRLDPIAAFGVAVIAGLQPDMGEAGTRRLNGLRRPSEGDAIAIPEVGWVPCHGAHEALWVHQ